LELEFKNYIKQAVGLRSTNIVTSPQQCYRTRNQNCVSILKKCGRRLGFVLSYDTRDPERPSRIFERSRVSLRHLGTRGETRVPRIHGSLIVNYSSTGDKQTHSRNKVFKLIAKTSNFCMNKVKFIKCVWKPHPNPLQC